MSRWRFLLVPRWGGYLALVIVFAIACCALGTWQLNRRAEALTEIARIDANYDAAPVPLQQVLTHRAGFDPNERWKVVALSGEYVVADEVLVRNRPFNGTTGYEVVTPFRLDDGTVFMVDRGWFPQNPNERPGAVPPPPPGHVEISARLKPGEDTISGRTTSGNELATIDLQELQHRVGAPSYTGAYGLLVPTSADPSPYPAALPRPPRDEGPHLSYALQWFVFALMAFVALGWAANQERKALEGAASGAGPTAAAGEVPKRDDRAHGIRTPKAPKKRRDRDADVEDDILDRV